METTLIIQSPESDSTWVTLSETVRTQFNERSPQTAEAIAAEMQNRAVSHLDADALHAQFITNRGHTVNVRYDLGLCVTQINSVPPAYRKNRAYYAFEISNELLATYSGPKAGVPKLQLRRTPTILRPAAPGGNASLFISRARWGSLLHSLLLSVPSEQRQNDHQVSGMMNVLRELLAYLRRTPALRKCDLLNMTLEARHDTLLSVVWLSDLMSQPVERWSREIAVRDEINVNMHELIRLVQPAVREVTRRLELLHEQDT